MSWRGAFSKRLLSSQAGGAQRNRNYQGHDKSIII